MKTKLLAAAGVAVVAATAYVAVKHGVHTDVKHAADFWWKARRR